MTSRQIWTIERNNRFITKMDVFFDRSNLTAGHFGTSGSSETLCTSFERSNQCVRGSIKLKGVAILFLCATPSWKKPFYTYKWPKVRILNCRSVTTFRGGEGTKMTIEAQGMWIYWSGALKSDQNFKKHEKRRKNMPVFAVFEHFWRFFNFGRILAHQTTKFTFLEVYCFFWHPTQL